MRFAVFHDQPSGGARRALRGFCAELSKRHHVDLFTLASADPRLPVEVSGRVTTLAYQPRPSIPHGLFLNDLRRRRELRALEAVNRVAAALIDAGGYDAVLVDACRFTYAPYVLAHLRTPAAYYCHHGPWRVEDRALRAPLGAYGAARRLWHLPLEAAFERELARVDRELTRRAAVVVVNSEYTARQCAARYGLAVRVCPPGIEVPEQPAAGGTDLLSVGAIEAHKGHDLLVEAVARLPEGARPRLRLVGNEANPVVRSRLESQARRLGVRLEVAVGVGEPELAAAYAGARVFLYGAHAEPLGLAPLEAMAHGLPVLAVAEGGPAETIADGRTGLLVPRDAGLFAGRLAALLADAGLRARLGAAARAEVAARWSWPRRAAALESVLASLPAGARQVAPGVAARVAV